MIDGGVDAGNKKILIDPLLDEVEGNIVVLLPQLYGLNSPGVCPP